MNDLNLNISEILQFFFSVVGLVGVNALLVAADFALIKQHFSRFDLPVADRATAGSPMEGLIKDVNRTSGVIRLAINLMTVALGFVLVEPLKQAGVAVNFPGFSAGAVVVGFSFAVCVHYLLGEIVPRALALNNPIRTLRVAGPLVYVFRFFLGPLVGLFARSAGRIFRMFGMEAEMETNILDIEVQMRALLKGGEDVSPIMSKILRNTIHLHRKVVQDILLPRNQIQYMDLRDTNSTNIDLAQKSGHTRFPLCEGDLDKCIGLVHIKDMFRSSADLNTADLRTFRRDILRFSLEDPLDVVLQRLLTQRRHMALVLDEFGGTVGAVTLEDVLEELVGDIQDEFDKEELVIKPLPDGEFLVDGLAPLHDVAEALEVEIGNDEVSTFGGYIVAELGRMPKENSTVTLGRLQIRILGASEKRVTTARVRLLLEEDETTSE